MFLHAAAVPWLLLDGRCRAITNSAASSLPSASLAATTASSPPSPPPYRLVLRCHRMHPLPAHGHVQPFGEILLEFHSNFNYILIQIFRISSNLVVSEFFFQKRIPELACFKDVYA
jgi:hypothetical protein